MGLDASTQKPWCDFTDRPSVFHCPSINRKYHTGFRSVPRSVSYVERPSSRVISRKTAVFEANCVELKLDHIFSYM